MKYLQIAGTILLLTNLGLGCLSARAEDLVFPARSDWKYWDRGSPAPEWNTPSFNDETWPLGTGGFAYNDDTAIGTTLSSTDSDGEKLLTAYFRKPFVLDNSPTVVAMRIELRRDDGAVVYLNGEEVLRDNMPSGVISYSTPAESTIDGADEDIFVNRNLNLSQTDLLPGTNIIAVEVHQRSAGSSDLIFDLALYSATNSAPGWKAPEITLSSATATASYSDDLSRYASDPDGDPMEFEKISGPEWLHVAADGTLSGIPPAWLPEKQLFVFRVSGDDGFNEAKASISLQIPDGFSRTRRYRVSWGNTDPSSETTIGWEQIEGDDAVVCYDTIDHGRNAGAYAHRQTVTHIGHFSRSGDIYTRFATLSGLEAGTLYYFVLQDDSGTSPRFCFKTAPNQPQPFTFIAGGDSRTNPEPRRKCNRLVAKLRPLFVAFTGDMTEDDTVAQWNLWLDDWQETISPDGRIFPILPHLGNHEEWGSGRIDELFDIPSERYYAISLGGNLLRYYVLNTEIEQGGEQTSWLTNDLAASTNFLHKAAGYHRPMRSHRTGYINDGAYTNWAEPFFKYGVELVFEADSHTVKRTWPVEPMGLGNGEDGFVRNDTNGIVFVGEGCWGAPLRNPAAIRSWTRDTGKFYGFNWVHVYSGRMELYTIRAENIPEAGAREEHTGIEIPSGLQVWEPPNGARVVTYRGRTPIKTSYTQWQIDTWGLPLPQQTGMDDDADHDGFSNFSEFAFGTSPTNPASPGSEGIAIPFITGGNPPQIFFRKPGNRTVSYQYQASRNLDSWQEMKEGVDYTIKISKFDTDNDLVELQLTPAFMEQYGVGFIRIRHLLW